MKKIVLTICVVLSALIINSSTAFAAVCPTSPTGTHNFSAHILVGAGYQTQTPHEYEDGVDHNGKPVMGTCVITEVHSYCMYKCVYCSSRNESAGSHTHITNRYHSVNHN